MKQASKIAHMEALAFLYDHLQDFPAWVRRLTNGQLEGVAKIMIAFRTIASERQIIPLDELEMQEVIRAMTLCDGDIVQAAKMLRIGKTTLYNKLKKRGYSVENRLLIHQASALAVPSRTEEPLLRLNRATHGRKD
jgi:DNA-binding NtrC family response regulator